MEPVEILPGDENAAVLGAKKTEPLADIVATVRSPLRDVSNRSLADVTLNGSSNQGDKTIVEVDDSNTCGSKSETESPASSTPSRLDTTTDDYESADEGSPIREVDLSLLANQLETLSLGTPKPLSPVRPGVLFPYSPVNDNSILLSSPEKNESGLSDVTVDVSPIAPVGSPPGNSWSPESDEGLSSGTNQILEPVFKVPEITVKRERFSVASSVGDGRSDDTFYTADSTFWSPHHNLNATIVKSTVENLDESSVKSPDPIEEHGSTTAAESVSCESQRASSEVERKHNTSLEESLLNRNPEAGDSSRETEIVKSPVNDFIANADKITLRDDSPLASSIKEKCYGEDLDSSLAPAQLEIEQGVSKRHSTGLCKKGILAGSVDEEFRRHSFHESTSDNEFGLVLESPDKASRRKSTKFFLNFEKEDVSTSSLDKSSDLSAELQMAKEVVDSCIAAATNDVIGSPQQDDGKVVNSNGVKENLDTVGTTVTEVEEVENTSFSNSERLLEETRVTHPNAASNIQVDDQRDSNIPEKDLCAENEGSTQDSEILTEDAPMPIPSIGLSKSIVSDGLSISDTKTEVSLDSDDSVSTNESTIIENENIVTSSESKQVVAHAGDVAKEETSISYVPDLPTGKTEVTVESEASVQPERENSQSPVQNEDAERHTVDQIVSSLSNKTIIEGGVLFKQMCEIADSLEPSPLKVGIESKLTSPREETHIVQAPEETAEPTSQFPVILSKSDSDANIVITSEPIHNLSSADNDKVDCSKSVPIETEIFIEKTEGTCPSRLQSSTTESIQADPPTESLPSLVDNEINMKNTPGANEETNIVHKFEDSIESAPTSSMPEIPCNPDSILNVTTSVEPDLELVLAHPVVSAKDDTQANISDMTEIPSEKTDETCLPQPQSNRTVLAEQPSDNLPSPVESEACTNDTSKEATTVECKIHRQTSEIIELVESLSLNPDVVEKLASPPDESLIVQRTEDVAGCTSVLPNHDAEVVSLSGPVGHADDSAKEDISVISVISVIPTEKTESPYLPTMQSSLTAPVEDEKIPLVPNPDVEAVSSNELIGHAADSSKEDISVVIPNGTAIPSEKTESPYLPTIQSSLTAPVEDEKTPLVPNPDVKAVSSNELIGHAADSSKEDISVVIPNGTAIPSEKTESTCLHTIQNCLTAPIEAEKLSESISSPVEIEAHSINTSREDSVMGATALSNQTSNVAESVSSSGLNDIAIENKLPFSSEDTIEHSSQLTGIPLKQDVNVSFPTSIEVDFSTGMSTLGKSFIVSKEGQDSRTTETNLNGINELIKKVDFSNLAGIRETPRQEQDIKSESMNFYSSPESTTDQNTSDDKGDPLDRSYKDLSKILATCSKQEQELGGRTFDFSCIQAEAAKIASDISAADEAKSSGFPKKQPMMQSSLSAETNNSEAGPVTADEDFNKEEFFQDVTALDFDYLAQAGNKLHCPSRLARQSLYVKFDPLVGKLLASSEDNNSSLVRAMADSNQSSGEEGKLDITPPPRSESDERLISITPAPAKKDVRQSAGGHTPSLRQEISKLQELMIQQEQAHQEKADLVEELRSRIAELEASDNHRDTSDLEKKLKQRDEELKHREDELDKARASNKQLVQVMEEYEKTISQLVTVKEETKAQMEKDKETIGAERDTALQHLTNMEIAFNDIHQKYERTKTVVETLHANEKELKKSYDAAIERVEAQNVAYQKLKQHAAEKLAAANAEIEKIHKDYNGEMARMKAVAKKNELKCKSLEESLEQKRNELRELTQICDELIANHTPS